MKAYKTSRPVSVGRRPASASRDAGALRGPSAGWGGPQIGSDAQAVTERIRAQRRIADLAANDWQAASILSTFCQNVIGTGLTPVASIPGARLGLSPEQAQELGRRMEWLWYGWARTADLRGVLSFGELQALGLRTMLAMGEMVHIPVMRDEAQRKADGAQFGLAIQAVAPSRLRTPAGMEADPAVVDGIRVNAHGRPLEYYIAAPDENGGSRLQDAESAIAFSAVPARVGHRPGMLHLFPVVEDEQYRGISIFANSCQLFRQVDDAIAFELTAQNVAAQFPVFIKRNPVQALPPGVYAPGDANPNTGEQYYYEDLLGPQIMYGNEGEEPQVLKNERPSSNFLNFVSLLQNALAASVGLPAIAVSKDFSQTNYSSSRAAMNEAWRTFKWFRRFLSERYCQPVWEMLMEEAWLRGMLELPAGAPGFYEARELWTSCEWVGPARGYMDPTKEIEADVMAVQNHLASRHEILAQNGRDFDDLLPILRDEQEAMNGLSSPAAPAAPVPSAPEPAPAGAEDSEKDDANAE